MKNVITVSLVALLLGSTSVTAQSDFVDTKPVGLVTHTLKSGQFNLIGLTLHQPIIASGSITAASSDNNGTPADISDDFSVFTDSAINFGVTLTAGTTYILEITDAADAGLNGTLQEVTVWSGNTITTPQDLFADGLVVGDRYQLRAASTIADVFGATNTAGLSSGTSATVADNIYLPTELGFDVYYYSTGGFFTVGWRKIGAGNADFANQPIFPADGFYILRRGSDLDITHTGAVKLDDTILAVTRQFTFFSGLYPVGSTLDSSGMVEGLKGGASASVADQVFIQNPILGGFDVYYYSTGGFFGIGWRKVGEGSTDFRDAELPSAFVIGRDGDDDFNLKIAAPEGYENL